MIKPRKTRRTTRLNHKILGQWMVPPTAPKVHHRTTLDDLTGCVPLGRF